MKTYKIKWTWFHKTWDGTNRVVQNTLLGEWVSHMMAELDFNTEKRVCLTARGFTLHRDDGNSVTYITKNGDFVNIRIC